MMTSFLEADAERLPRLYLIGDSTVRVGTDGQRGWGEEIAPFFNPDKMNVFNHAIAGRSSRTFLTDGRWDRILAELQSGDFVLIQFGHNDGAAINDDSRARGTLQGTGEESEEIENQLTGRREVVHTYGWYIRKYVRETLEKGATPIVCSPVPRKIWEDDKIVRDRYTPWAKTAAAEARGFFLDLNEIIALRYERLGSDEVARFFADERTHTNAAGARFNAESVVIGLKALEGGPLNDYLAAGE